tara:strand:+ start:442 stop:1428 length:987 start_codon:yes stop_codon:yes gene_type:complete
MNKIRYPLKVIGTGSYVPNKIIKNEEIIKNFNTSHDWITENLGIFERRVTEDNECTSDLAANAAKNAIEDSKLDVNEIDLLIVATATPDRLSPSTACIVQEKIGALNAVAFDISAVCSGFLFGLSIVSQYLQSGMFKNVLLIGSDNFSKITDWSKRDSIFFGDGSGAAVITTGSESGIIAQRIYSDGRGKFNFTVPGGGSELPLNTNNINKGLNFFSMNGRSVYEVGTQVLPKAINQVLKDSDLSIDQIDLLIPHQPSIKTLKKTAEIINIPWNKVMTNMDKFANTAGATIPLLMDQVNKSGGVKRGNNVLFAAVGSGWTYGSIILKW